MPAALEIVLLRVIGAEYGIGIRIGQPTRMKKLMSYAPETQNKFKMAGNIEHGMDNLEIVDIGIKHVGDDGLGFPRAIEDIDMGGDNGENRVILKSQPKDDGASLVDINETYFEGVNANSNTSVDVSYNTLDFNVDFDESYHRDEITNEALWSDNEEVREVRRQKAIMEKLMEEETMKNNKNVTKESKKDNDNDNIFR
ncbi:hypothetical protein Ancab_027454 [Ancistrocladus abbreviatus]